MSEFVNFPRQQLRFSQKTKKWRRQHLDWADSKTFFNNSPVRKSVIHKKINYDLLAKDDFDAYFVDRAIKLLNRIEKATGKSIAGRDSEETIREFGVALTKASES